MSERIARELRLDFYQSLLSKDVEFFESNRTGDLRKKHLLMFSFPSELGHLCCSGQFEHQCKHACQVGDIHRSKHHNLLHHLTDISSDYVHWHHPSDYFLH